jgi:protocatechuate 3,4-dioxygenase, beta subunit
MERYLSFEPPYEDSASSVSQLRMPVRPPIHLPPDWFHHVKGPVFDQLKVRPEDSDLTAHGVGEPIGTRVIVYGRVSDSDGRPVRRSLVEIWQANAAGGYFDSLDVSGFPLDPNFTGAGRCMTDDDGNYRFVTIRPGPYPALFRSGQRAWRASHIHFSLFGEAFQSRLVTQMYFEGDPLIKFDRMINAIPDVRGQERLIGRLDPDQSIAESFGPPRQLPTRDGSGVLVYPPQRTDPQALTARNPSALAYRFDIVLRGSGATPFET